MKHVFRLNRCIDHIDIKLVINKCSKCGCGFAFTEDDIEEDRDGRYVTCPNCGSFIDVQYAQKSIDFENNDCRMCAADNPERAKLCDEAKADTMCEAFRKWYKENYKDEKRS